MMSKEIEFHAIDMLTWPMAQAFHYYTQMAPVTYTVNVTMDVTALRKTLNCTGYKFFPAYLYLVTKAVAGQRELCTAVQNGVVGYWDCLHPVYPVFHEDDKTTSLLWTEYDGCFDVFYKRYTEDRAKHSDGHGILSSKGMPPSNACIVSCIPWFSFNSFSLHNHGIKDYFFPSFEAGAFTESESKTTMPLSVTVHHATTEGYHLKVFFEELQRSIDHPEEWL